MRPAARVTDPTLHGGPLLTGAPSVLINGKPAVRVGDAHLCPAHGMGPVVEGNVTVIICGAPASRWMDRCLCIGVTDSSAGSTGSGSSSGNGEAEAHAGGFKARAKRTPEGYTPAEDGRMGGKLSLVGAGEVSVGVDSEYGGTEVGVEVEGPSGEIKGGSPIPMPTGRDTGGITFGQRVRGSAAKVKVKVRERAGIDGVIEIDERTSGSRSVGSVSAPGDSPAGGWLFYDWEKGELRYGYWGKVGDWGMEKDVKIRIGGKKATGSIPNQIARGSDNVKIGG